ncbi:uncharacterized protein LOC144034240 [Vanacampus margaritifer]
MRAYLAAWMSFCVQSSFLRASRAVECSGKETLLQPLSSPLPQLTDCLKECTEMTYAREVQRQDHRNVRIEDSTQGDLGEYCWATTIKCNVHESFQHAFVVLPIHTSAVTPEALEVRWAANALNAHTDPITVPDACGLRYDVSEHFGPGRRVDSFCVEVVGQRDSPATLRCPPYLVTYWQRSPTPI